MKWPNDTKDFALPVRDVDVGQPAEAGMRLGVSGIRTVEWTQPDGSVVRLSNRGGYPLFEEGESIVAAEQVGVRGFLAKNPTTNYAVLFDPYTLAVLETDVKYALNTYTVQEFATTWNVPVGDTTDWYDVVLFDGSTIKVNARTYANFKITPTHTFSAIPHVITSTIPGSIYGTSAQNTTQKRVFAVGRYSVKAYGGSTVTEMLAPAAPRTDKKAMTVGPRIDRATDKAWLGQLYFTGDYYYSIPGDWKFASSAITMKLAAAYLTNAPTDIAVVKASGGFTSIVTGSRLVNKDVVSDPTNLGILSEGSFDETYIDWKTADLWWKGSSVIKEPLALLEGETFSDTSYSDINTEDFTLAGIDLTYTRSNIKKFALRTNMAWTVKVQTLDLPYWDVAVQNNVVSLELINPLSSPSWLPSGKETPNVSRGSPPFTVTSPRAFTAATTPYSYNQQDLSIAVVADNAEIGTVLSITGFRYENVSGQRSTLVPNTTRYNSSVGERLYDPDYQVSAKLRVFFGGSVPVGDQPTVTQILDNKIEEWKESSYAYTIFSAGGVPFDQFTVSVSTVTAGYSSTLNWSTKDFLLCDQENSVYVTIEGQFTGTGDPADVTLTVLLRIKTRHHDTVIMLGTWDFAYTTLLPEDGTVPAIINTPRTRVMVAPLYQEQGSCPFAHYVTKAEELNGAAAFHGFSLFLHLQMYEEFGNQDTKNAESKDVYFVPCNLVEMLYCFLFSQKYGLDIVSRYPVTETAIFNQLSSELFKAYRVAVRNGIQSNWTDALGPQFSSISNTTLHRA